MSEKKVELKVTANVDGAVGEIKKLQGAVGNAGKVGELFGSSMSGGIGQVSSALSSVSGAFSGISGIASSALGPIALVAMAIGAVIAAVKGLVNYVGEALTKTVEWGRESKKLATILNITTQEATALNIAIDDSFSSTDAYTGAVNKLGKSISAHPDIYRQMGVSLKDNQGHYRNTNDIMLDVLKRFNEMPDSLEKNIAMQKVFGKSWQEVLPLLGIAEKMENARKEVEKFGLAMDPKELKKYREAQDDVKDVFDYMKIAMGENLMPVVTDVMDSLGSMGKEILPYVINAFKFFAIVMNVVWTGVKSLGLELVILKDLFMVLVNFLGDIDWAHPIDSMGKAFDKATEKVKTLFNTWKAKGNELLDESKDRFNRILDAGQGGEQKKKGGPVPDVDDDRTNLQKLKDNIEQTKLMEMEKAEKLGQIRQFTAAEELKYLEDEMKNYSFSKKDQAQLDQMVLQAKLKVHKSDYDSAVSSFDLQITKAKGNYDEQIRIANLRMALTEKVYGKESKEAQDAAKKVIELEQKKIEEIKKVEQLKLDASQQHAKAQMALEDLITDNLLKNNAISGEQAIAMKQATEQRIYELELEALNKRLEVKGLEPSEIEKINNDIAALQDQHVQKMTGLNLQMNAELQKEDGWAGAMQSAQTFIDQSNNSFANWGAAVTSTLQGAKSAFASFFASIFESGKTGAQKWDALWKALVKTVIQSIATLIANWIVGKIAAAIFGDSVTEAAKAQAVASQQAAAAATWSAYAGIPFVGPALAMAQIVLMNTSLVANLAAAKASTKAYAVGGLIDKPTYALMGEAGPELVAPERDFKYWAKSLVFAGSELQSQIAARQSSALGYSQLASGYSLAAQQAAQQPKPQGHIFNITTWDPQAAGKSIHEALTNYQMNFA